MTDTNKDDTKSWVSDLEGYIRQGEPKRAAKAKAWQAAIGLQDVDNLKVSDYLLDTAKQNIEGEIDTQEARQRIDSYYEARRARGIVEDRTEEADKVAQRISELLEEESTCPLNQVKTEDGWADEIMVHMVRCKHCGQVFTCVVNTYRGSGSFRKGNG